ncbi:HK97 gp10 family phage protein [Hymenobacter sp. BT175]|nr:HK97 gp10 family phage protein [Hymenobacter translucens]
MAAKNTFQFQGFKEVEQLLDALPKRLGEKTLQSILRKNARPLIQRGRELVPRNKGTVAKSLGTIAGRGAGRGTSVYVGPRRSKAFNGYAAHLIEFGTAPRVRKDGRATGSMPAQPFWRPAFEQTKDQVIAGIRLDIKAVLDGNFKDLNFD